MSANTKSTVFGNSLIWFGAAVSIAEILTGTLFAPLGLGKGLVAIVVGHAIGCVLLYAAGLIGAQTGLTAMETVKGSFGRHGGRFFAAANVIQLIGWTAVMIASGGQAASALYAFGGLTWLWPVIIGALILVWLLMGVNSLEKTNIVTMVLLFGLTLVLCRVVFKGGAAAAASEETLRFGDALELSIAMPVSWLPLIADYTSNAQRPRLACLVSAAVYFVVSCWMYAIGLGAALFAGNSDIAEIMLKAGLGAAGLLIVVLSTVTTTFLDVYSAGVSAKSIHGRLPVKAVGAAVCVVGVVLALLCDTSSFESFLYWIGSVFVPMITVQLMDTLVLRQPRQDKRAFSVNNLLLWAVGFVLYRLFLQLNLPCGSTIPDMAATALLCLLVGLVERARKSRKSH